MEKIIKTLKPNKADRDINIKKPMFDKNRNELIQLFDMISQNGIGSILSVKGGMIISKLAKRK